MTKEETEKGIGVKITEKEYEYLRMCFGGNIGVVLPLQCLQVLSNYRYKKLQDYENRIHETFEALRELQKNILL